METPRRKIGKTSWASCLKQKQTTWVKGKRCRSLQLNTPSILQLCPIEFHSVPESHYVIFHWAYCSLGNTFHEKDLATIYTMNPHLDFGVLSVVVVRSFWARRQQPSPSPNSPAHSHGCTCPGICFLSASWGTQSSPRPLASILERKHCFHGLVAFWLAISFLCLHNNKYLNWD